MINLKIATVGKICKAGVFFTLSLLLFFTGGCKKKNNNPVSSNNNSTSQVSFTVNGGGYNNQDININNSGSSGAIYVTDKNFTLGTINGISNNKNVSVIIAFSGKSTGTFAWDTTSSSIGFGFTFGGVTYSGIPGQGKTTVTQYGDVGSAIKGTFSGNVFGVSGSTIDTIQISNGQFSMIRGKDQSTIQGKK